MNPSDAIRIQQDPSDANLVQLVLCGQLSIENAKELHAAAMEVLERGMNARVDCTNATELDLTSIQLMVALAVDLSKRGKECRVVGIPAGTGELMRHAGL